MNAYVKKPRKDGYELCRVIASSEETGAALVFNRNTNAVEVLPLGMYVNAADYEQTDCNLDEDEFELQYRVACRQYAEFIDSFSKMRVAATEYII